MYISHTIYTKNKHSKMCQFLEEKIMILHVTENFSITNIFFSIYLS